MKLHPIKLHLVEFLAWMIWMWTIGYNWDGIRPITWPVVAAHSLSLLVVMLFSLFGRPDDTLTKKW